jgi:hypothetical protein
VAADFIDSFLAYTDQVPSPYIFRLWAGIAGVAGALERRVWVRALPQPTFANLYVLLVASPGIGKGVIDEITHVWKRAKKLHLAPDSVTSASLLDALLDARRLIVKDGVPEFEYHSLIVPSEEFGVLVPAHDLEFLSRLNRIFTNPEELRVRRKYIKEEIRIVQPQLTILAGTQPGYLASLLPEEAWSMGFTQRILFIHASKGEHKTLFAHEERSAESIGACMRQLADMKGEVRFAPVAAKRIGEWHNAGGPPRPSHVRLTHYLNRRTQFMLKLMLVSCASRLDGGEVIEFDYERALTWLLAAEHHMPDVFLEMAGKSDANVLSDLSYWGWTVYTRTKSPIHESRIHAFLSTRVPSEKVPHIFALAIRSALWENIPEGSKTWVPRARETEA